LFSDTSDIPTQLLAEALPPPRVLDEHHILATGLHRLAALLGVKLVIDQNRRLQVVASRQLGHEPTHTRLGAKAWSASGKRTGY
jgi:hypothetical protein